MIKNSKGNVYYGMHFYPGVAEYREPGQDPYRVFLNEDTIRKMDPSFAGRPVFVDHVDGVEKNVDELRKEADGWVIESFFNSCDGKHWVKFIVVTEKGEKAIRDGFRLSNAYFPLAFTSGGMWNGVDYQKEITHGEYEHLAMVQNPRYEESVILSPEEFKKYNEDKVVELERLKNSQDQERNQNMGLNIFKRTKVENTTDLESHIVELPKSKKQISIGQLVNEADDLEVKQKNGEVMADPSHKVKLHDGSMCNVGELLEKHKAMHDEMKAMKDEAEKEGNLEMEEGDVDSESSPEMKNDDLDVESSPEMENGDNPAKISDEDDEEKEVKDAKKKNAKEAADKLRKANKNAQDNTPAPIINFADDKVALGKKRYGS